MSRDPAAAADLYEVLQINRNADPDTIQRIFRILAQRYHPDNATTGNAERFRDIHDAYVVLNDPEKRAQYDARYEAVQQDRWRFVAAGPPDDEDFAREQYSRFLVLEILYSRRRLEPEKPSLSLLDLSRLTGSPREHLEFPLWYLVNRRLIGRDDQSSFTITVDGIDYVEQHAHTNRQRLRLVANTSKAS
jgi:curved DNA-binding protein CbpA